MGYMWLGPGGRTWAEGARVMNTAAGARIEDMAIDTPALGDRSYLAHDQRAARAGLPLDGSLAQAVK